MPLCYRMEILTENLSDFMPVVLIVAALLVLFIGTGFVRRVRNRLGRKRPQNIKEINVVANMVNGLFAVVVILLLLQALNVPLGNVWTAVSAVFALVAIGFFAVWSILSHMTAAIVIFFQRPFRTGEYLQFADESYTGRVQKTGLFFTTIEDDDGGFSQIPNNLLFQRRFRVTPNAPGKEREAPA